MCDKLVIWLTISLELCNSQTEPPTQADHRATTAARDIYRYYMEREDDKSQHTRPGQTARQQESQTSQAEQSARTSVCKTQEDDPTFGKVREALKDYLDDKTLAERLGVLQASPSKSPSNEEVTLGDWLKRNTEANHVHEDDLTV